MKDALSTVQNSSLAAGATTGLLGVISNNATAISVIATVGFGLIYASCAIWNAWSNHKRTNLSERDIIDGIIERAKDNGEEEGTIKAIKRAARR